MSASTSPYAPQILPSAMVRTVARRSPRNSEGIAAIALWRLLILATLFLIFCLLIAGRLTSLAVFEGTRAFGAVTSSYVPQRGDIVSRNGVPLARTIQAYAVWVKPNEIFGNKKQLSQQLAQIFPEKDASYFYAKLTADKPGYLVKRAIPEQVRAVHDLGEIAIEFPREDERLYPQHDLAAHVLGFVNRDGKGALGVERAFEGRLSDEKQRAEPLVLSLDERVQAALESELNHGMVAYGAKSAAGVILDVHTGEVLAMSTLPSFNPNRPLFVNDPKNGEELPAGRVPLSRQINNVTNRVYELGSTFKPLTVAAALDAGTVRDLAIRYDATAPLKVGGFKISDDHAMGRWLNVPETLVHSSNIVTARIADNLGRPRMESMLRNLGFDARPTIEIGERAQPLWPHQWGRVTNMTIGYGHGISVTPMHLASAYAAMVNGGIWRPATLLKVKEGDKRPEKRVFTAATSARMRQLLRMIVSDGTGRKADAEGFRVGGKTGSAEKAGLGGYNKTAVVATFAAAFPMDNPRYVIVAMVDEPKGTEASGFQRTAGWTVAPIVQKTVNRIGPMLGVIPDTGRDVDVSELTPLLWSPKGG